MEVISKNGCRLGVRHGLVPLSLILASRLRLSVHMNAKFECWHYQTRQCLLRSCILVPIYSEDLRWRMVWQREALGYTYAKIAENLWQD